MRKLYRSMLRAKAEEIGAKPSKYIYTMWHKHQNAIVGINARLANQVKGTSCRKKWRVRLKLINYTKGKMEV